LNTPENLRRFLLIWTSFQATLPQENTPYWAVQKSGATTTPARERQEVPVGKQLASRCKHCLQWNAVDIL